ncbi:hypothetical protein B0H10DRAFT_1953655 [Mycena sp. CBHHK59/15]|nr:hypothetical protein B0H10DRAFT_1953655 [Mycena sp. CBHHK59/15]
MAEYPYLYAQPDSSDSITPPARSPSSDETISFTVEAPSNEPRVDHIEFFEQDRVNAPPGREHSDSLHNTALSQGFPPRDYQLPPSLAPRARKSFGGRDTDPPHALRFRPRAFSDNTLFPSTAFYPPHDEGSALDDEYSSQDLPAITTPSSENDEPTPLHRQWAASSPPPSSSQYFFGYAHFDRGGGLDHSIRMSSQGTVDSPSSIASQRDGQSAHYNAAFPSASFATSHRSFTVGNEPSYDDGEPQYSIQQIAYRSSVNYLEVPGAFGVGVERLPPSELIAPPSPSPSMFPNFGDMNPFGSRAGWEPIHPSISRDNHFLSPSYTPRELGSGTDASPARAESGDGPPLSPVPSQADVGWRERRRTRHRRQHSPYPHDYSHSTSRDPSADTTASVGGSSSFRSSSTDSYHNVEPPFSPASDSPMIRGRLPARVHRPSRNPYPSAAPSSSSANTTDGDLEDLDEDIPLNGPPRIVTAEASSEYSYSTYHSSAPWAQAPSGYSLVGENAPRGEGMGSWESQPSPGVWTQVIVLP